MADKKFNVKYCVLLPIVLFTVLNLAFGVCSGPVLAFLRQIAEGVI